jgi:hypothetical protein
MQDSCCKRVENYTHKSTTMTLEPVQEGAFYMCCGQWTLKKKKEKKKKKKKLADLLLPPTPFVFLAAFFFLGTKFFHTIVKFLK